MTTATRIYARHECRWPIANASTYYQHKSDFIPLVDKELAKHGWTLGAFDMPNDEGHSLAPIVDGNESEIGLLSVSWYRVPSGRYEITLYVA